MIKKETLLIAIGLSMLIGFLAGTAFTVYRLKSGQSQTSSSEPSPTALGDTAHISNDQLAAIAALEAEVEKNHDSGEAWVRLGNLYFDTQQAKKAITAYNHALDLLPPNADILTDLGVVYRQDKQPEKAIASFEKATQTNPKHEPARLNKGIVLLFDLGQPQEAIKVWQELLAINPEAVTPNGQPLRDLIAEVSREFSDQKEQPAK